MKIKPLIIVIIAVTAAVAVGLSYILFSDKSNLLKGSFGQPFGQTIDVGINKMIKCPTYSGKKRCENISGKVCAEKWVATSQALPPPPPPPPPPTEDRNSCTDGHSDKEGCLRDTSGPCVMDTVGSAGEFLWRHDKDRDGLTRCIEYDCSAFSQVMGCPVPVSGPENGGSCTSAYLNIQECMQFNPNMACIARSRYGFMVDRNLDGKAGSDDPNCAQWSR